MKLLLGSPYREPYDNGRMIAEALRRAGARIVHWDTRNPPTVVGRPMADFAASIILKPPRALEVDRLPGYRICIWPDALGRSTLDERAHMREFDRVLACNHPGAHTWAEWFPLGWSETLVGRAPQGLRRDVPALFVGTANSASRVEFVRALRKRLGSQIVIHGNGWPHDLRAKPPLYYGEYMQLLARCKVVVNRHESREGPNLKVFEIPPLSAMVVDAVPGLSGLGPDMRQDFEHDDPAGAADRVEQLLGDAEMREGARRNQFRAIEPYSYEKQMRRLFEELKR